MHLLFRVPELPRDVASEEGRLLLVLFLRFACLSAYASERLLLRTATRMTITLYGIKNCDTMKKARSWLASHEVQYAFHDYKTAGIEPGVLARWCSEVGWETLLNRAGTTFRKLPPLQREDLDERKAVSLMLAQPSM